MTLEFIKQYTKDINQFSPEELILLQKCVITSWNFQEGEMQHSCSCYNRCGCNLENGYGCYKTDDKLVLYLSGKYKYKFIINFNRLGAIEHHFIKYLKEEVENDPYIGCSEVDYKDEY